MNDDDDDDVDDDDEANEEDVDCIRSNSSSFGIVLDDGANAVRFGDERTEFDAPEDLRLAT